MLGITDEYTAFCLDEAGAFLLAQPEPPNYKRQKQKPLNRNLKQIHALKSLGVDVRI